MKSRAAAFVLFALVSLVAAPTFAQITQGRLTGLVSDSQGAVLPGVTVTATSPALIGIQTAVTQPDGKYLFPALPSGAYKLVFELSGFQKLTRENIQVSTGNTISIDAQLPIASLNESVTVTGASPVVDVTSTKVGTDMKAEQLAAIPTSTDVWGALSQAPGIRLQGFDVGGSHKSQQSGYESFGIQNQAKVVSDGVDHTEGVGGTGFYEDYYANEEVAVGALGGDVEMNSPGASIVTTIKSGGNTFKGLEHFSYEPGSFVGSNGNPSNIQSRGYVCPTDGTGAVSCNNPNLLFWEGHADLGGPVLKDKIWFYAAYNQFHIDKQVAGVAQSVATDLGLFKNETAKGTGKLNQNNTLIGYFQRGRKQKPHRNLSTLVPAESILAQDSASQMYKGEWQSVLSDKAFLSVNVGRFTLAWPMATAVDSSVSPPVQYRGNNAISGAGWNAFSSNRSKPQVKAQMTYFLPSKAGSHDFKFGFEDIKDWYRFGINGQSGPYRISYPGTPTNPGNADRIRFVDTGQFGAFGSGWTPGANVDQHYAGYIQDRWAPSNRISISAGVRVDHQNVGYEDGTRTPVISSATTALQVGDGGRIFPAQSTIAGASLLNKTNAAARIGLSYNLDGKGQSVLKAFYGRYYNNLADGFSSANPAGTSYIDYNFNDLNHNGKYDGVQELGTFRQRIGGADAPVDPNAKTPHTDEYSFTVEHQFWGESSLRGTYVRKMQKDFLPFYYTSLVSAWIGSNGQQLTTVPVNQVVNGVTYNLMDVPNSLASQTGGVYTNYPNSDFTYDTIEFAFQKRIGPKIFIQASADYQWRDELRSADQVNSTGGSTSPLSTDPLGVFPQISVNPSAPNRQKTTMYHAQLAGRYLFPYDVGFGVNYRFQSGFPYALIVPDGTVNLNVCNFECSFFTQNLDQNRSESVNLLNFRIDKSVPISGRFKASVMLDIYNVLNADPVTNFNLAVTAPRTVIAVLDPRVFQLGFRFEF
ncbi:MAG TPA: carboxypeptidase regulatory-like domain-containing protein [Vicinamibacterales bacterium]|nr:carboxypeptidase regulatory-like domain-containing protein [Vicinamibacterales bacterium]